MQPLNEQPNDDAKQEKSLNPEKLSLLLRCRQWLIDFFEFDGTPAGTLNIRLEEQKFQGELLLRMPTNMQPTKMVIVGDWGDSYPEVQLVQLKL